MKGLVKNDQMDEIFIISEGIGGNLKLKKVINGLDVKWQIYDNADKRWRVIKEERVRHHYQMYFVQERKVIIEKINYGNKKKKKSKV
jgi:hypothetical protein